MCDNVVEYYFPKIFNSWLFLAFNIDKIIIALDNTLQDVVIDDGYWWRLAIATYHKCTFLFLVVSICKTENILAFFNLIFFQYITLFILTFSSIHFLLFNIVILTHLFLHLLFLFNSKNILYLCTNFSIYLLFFVVLLVFQADWNIWFILMKVVVIKTLLLIAISCFQLYHLLVLL